MKRTSGNSFSDEPEHPLHRTEVADQQLLLSVHLTRQRVEETNSGALNEVVILAFVLGHDEQEDVDETLVIKQLKPKLNDGVSNSRKTQRDKDCIILFHYFLYKV